MGGLFWQLVAPGPEVRGAMRHVERRGGLWCASPYPFAGDGFWRMLSTVPTGHPGEFAVSNARTVEACVEQLNRHPQARRCGNWQRLLSRAA